MFFYEGMNLMQPISNMILLIMSSRKSKSQPKSTPKGSKKGKQIEWSVLKINDDRIIEGNKKQYLVLWQNNQTTWTLVDNLIENCYSLVLTYQLQKLFKMVCQSCKGQTFNYILQMEKQFFDKNLISSVSDKDNSSNSQSSLNIQERTEISKKVYEHYLQLCQNQQEIPSLQQSIMLEYLQMKTKQYSQAKIKQKMDDLEQKPPSYSTFVSFINRTTEEKQKQRLLKIERLRKAKKDQQAQRKQEEEERKEKEEKERKEKERKEKERKEKEEKERKEKERKEKEEKERKEKEEKERKEKEEKERKEKESKRKEEQDEVRKKEKEYDEERKREKEKMKRYKREKETKQKKRQHKRSRSRNKMKTSKFRSSSESGSSISYSYSSSASPNSSQFNKSSNYKPSYPYYSSPFGYSDSQKYSPHNYQYPMQMYPQPMNFMHPQFYSSYGKHHHSAKYSRSEKPFKLVVFELPQDQETATLTAFFKSFNEEVNIDFVLNKGMAYLKYKTLETATQALQFFKEKNMNINWAK